MKEELILKIVLAVVLIIEHWLSKTKKVDAGSIFQLIEDLITSLISKTRARRKGDSK